jgi:glycosyltransferase involved in cell wall biosynthesis
MITSPTISILLPSLRGPAAKACIEAFGQTQTGVDYEIILVAPFEITDPRVRCILETKPRGVVAAMNRAFVAAKAPVVAFWADDAKPLPGCLQAMLDMLNALPGTLDGTNPTLGAFRMRYPNRAEAEQWTVYDRLYACFGAIRKIDASLAGGLFDHCFKSYWADPDLAMRIWNLGGQVKLCKDAFVEIDQIQDNLAKENHAARFALDYQTFARAWADEVPPENWKLINKPVAASAFLDPQPFVLAPEPTLNLSAKVLP